MQDAHSILKHAVKNFVGIPDERNDMHARPLDNPCGEMRTCGYVRDELTNAEFDGGSDRRAKHAAVGGHLTKISRGPLTELDFHSPRNDLNAASTSSSLATPLRSASSSAANSSAVA